MVSGDITLTFRGKNVLALLALFGPGMKATCQEPGHIVMVLPRWSRMNTLNLGIGEQQCSDVITALRKLSE